MDETDQERVASPNRQRLTGAGFARRDTTVSCVLTRFRLRSFWSFIPFYLAFRRIRRDARDVHGLLQAVFLIEDLRTCYTLSLWENEFAIVDFSSTVHVHGEAARFAFGATYRTDVARPEIWSVQFQLLGVSCNNLNWNGFDLQTILAEQERRRECATTPSVEGKEVTDGL